MISQYLGFDSDYIIIGLSAVVLILLILFIVNTSHLYSTFRDHRNTEMCFVLYLL